MLLNTLDSDDLYAALVRRDPDFDGRAFVGVTTTGIFCRLTCPARKPLREHCRFFSVVGDCLEAGFRPCKRCSPLRPAADADPVIQRLIEALDTSPERRWTESDVSKLGVDPSTVRRSFKRHFGVTFLEMARLRRLREGLGTLSRGGSVIEAQLDSGFDSSSGFRAACARWLGVAPGSFSGDELLKADCVATPLGSMIAVTDRTSLHLLEFLDRRALGGELRRLRQGAQGRLGIGRYEPTDQVAEELGRFFAGVSAEFRTPLTLHGGAFARTVWSALRRIPPGETRSYGAVARAIGRPSAVRAVARANGANQIAIVIPCHRVIGADGTLTGYAGGLWRKQKLIDLERQFSTRSVATASQAAGESQSARV